VATSRKRSELSDPELKLLFGEANNRCAFRDCGTILASVDDAGGAVILGEAAHIVAAGRQGPRGNEPVDELERDKRASNRILLCASHHTIVDKRPYVYTVEVLRQMKRDHIAAMNPGLGPSLRLRPDFPIQRTAERLHASLLPVVGLPVVVESASLVDRSLSEGEVARRLSYPPRSRGIVYPFIVRESRLWTFSHLGQRGHPFGGLVDTDIEAIALTDLAGDEEGHRRVVALLNRALGRHLGMRGVRFDREHQRYWFLPDRDRATGGIAERSYAYVTKTGRNLTRPTVHHARRRSGEFKGEWYHEAARLRFERFDDSWFLTVRPEFHLTLDGETPMQAHRIGRKITRKKSHLYNDGYLDRLWFWKHFLADGGPRLTIKTGDQSILVEGMYATTDVAWPGVPGDVLVVKSAPAAETLFTIADFDDDDDAAGDEAYWDEDDEDEA
jgi:hypothetical protein